jgi:hypothetical protein
MNQKELLDKLTEYMALHQQALQYGNTDDADKYEDYMLMIYEKLDREGEE